jgi:hypothetical protein
MLILLLVAGNETTTNLIGNAALELLAHPDALAAVRADPSLVPSAVEEVLRYASPVQMDPRIATRDVEIQGKTIPAGEFVLSWLGSANRDEAVFDRPESFDVPRGKPPLVRLRTPLLPRRVARDARGRRCRARASRTHAGLPPHRRCAVAVPPEHRVSRCDEAAHGARAGVNDVASLARAWRMAGRVVVLTGAGLSTASGIPDFRSPGGRWSRYRPVTIQEFLASEDDRARYWRYKGETWEVIQAAVPNAAHVALADLARAERIELLVTQNVDGLHERSGFPAGGW